MDNYRLLNKFFNNKKEDKSNLKRYLRILALKSLICLVIFLVALIAIKMDSKNKEIIYKNVYEKNISFAVINDLYKKYFGNILPLDNIAPEEKPVFNEKLDYSDASLFKDGVKLTVAENYLVPILESGIVVFIGEKDDYGKTIIIQQVNGIDVWYGNINIGDIKIYDYVEKGKMLGEAQDKTLYILFQKNGKYLDYKEYL